MNGEEEMREDEKEGIDGHAAGVVEFGHLVERLKSSKRRGWVRFAGREIIVKRIFVKQILKKSK